MANKFLATGDHVHGLILRLTLGIVMFPHGAQKLLGWWGGGGWSGTIGFFEQAWGIPAFVTMLIIIGEFFGSIGLVVGFLTRLCAGAVVAIMLGAIYFHHAQYGFFMNWGGQNAGEGYEFHLLALGIGLTLLAVGAGKASVDRAIAGRR